MATTKKRGQGTLARVTKKVKGAANSAVKETKKVGKAAAKTVADKFGKLDILINNAGVGSQTDMFALTVSETTEEELQIVFGTNVFSVVATTREFLPLLKKSDAGRIVNLSSILGSLTLHADPNSPIAREGLARSGP